MDHTRLMTKIEDTYIQELLYRDEGLENTGFFQGDIAIADKKKVYSAVVIESSLWPEGVVYYDIDTSLDSIRDDIMRAMETIQNQIKCIKFKQRDPETRDYAFLTKKTGCWSFVGRQGGSQQVSLDSTCFAVGVIIHELIHVIGFWHEHSRSDRDEYIQILWENIIEDQKSNFQKFDIWDNNLLGETFDYDSIMMYGLYTFSKDGASQTMKAIQENVTILPVSSKVQLSDSDIRRIKKLYECDGMIRPPVPDVPPTKCDFELDYCHMSNQMDPGLALWKRIRGRMGSLKGDHTTGEGVYLAYDVEKSNFYVARLISNYYKTHNRQDGCLTFFYHLSGTGTLRIYYQTETSAAMIFHSSSTTIEWQQKSLDVHFLQLFRFIFEAHTVYRGSHYGLVGLDDVKFTWKKCNQ